MWIYKGVEVSEDDIPEDTVGFVYVITNTVNDKKYIGQKKVSKRVTKTLVKRDKNNKIIKDKDGKSIKVKKKFTESSDWQTYYGSNEQIKNEVKEFGADRFKREILYFGKSKALMNYLETLLQFKEGVLFDDNYYNGIVNCRISTSQLKKVPIEEIKIVESIKIIK